LCLAPRDVVSSVGSPLRLSLYLQNLSSAPLRIPQPDWLAPTVQFEDDVLTLTYISRPDAPRAIEQPPQSIRRYDLFIERAVNQPGTVRLRARLNFSETAGSAISNETTIRLRD
jgi:hypothetical protein